MSPSANLTMRINGGAPVTGAQQIQPSDVVQFDATSYAGWGSPAAIYEFPVGSYPKTWPCPAGWTDNAGSYQYTVNSIGGYKPPAVTFPAPAGLWGSWLPRLVVNGTLVDNSCALEIRSPILGLHETASREESQFGGPDRGWMGPEQDNLQALEALGNSVGAGGVILTSATPAAVTAASGIVGVGGTAARSDHRHAVTVATPGDVGAANAAGVATSLARSDHTHKLPFSALAAAAVTASSAVDWNGVKLINVGPPTLPGDVVTLAYASALVDFTAVKTALGAATSNISINGWQIVNVGTPTTATSAVNKGYVDAAATGLDLKAEVRGSSLATRTLVGPLTEDGITYVTGDRYLARHQASPADNGIYDVNTAGSWTRSADASISALVTPGMFCFVLEGTTNSKTGWALFTTGPIVLGTTPLVFTQIFGPGNIIAGSGLVQVSNTLNVSFDIDGSIIAGGGGGIKVGVLATDAQHGNRGNGALHAVATGGAAGFMPAAHFTLVNNASFGATANSLPLRGASGELSGAWYTNGAGVSAGTASGLLRAAGNVVVAAARVAAGSADHTLLATDNADGLLLGDLVHTALLAVKMKAAGIFQLFADTTKVITGSAAGVAFGGDVDAGGGVGIFNLHDATTPPATAPSNGAQVYAAGGAMVVTTPAGIRTTINAAGEGAGTPTLNSFDVRVGRVETTTTTPTLILALTIPSTLTYMEAELHVLGFDGVDAFDSRLLVRCRRLLAGVVNITSYSMTGVSDLDDFGGCTFTGSANGNNLEIKVVGTAVPISWMCEARVTLFQP